MNESGYIKEPQNAYTEDGLLILPPNILIPKSSLKSKYIYVNFSQIQEKKENDFFQDILDEMKELFRFNLTDDEGL